MLGLKNDRGELLTVAAGAGLVLTGCAARALPFEGDTDDASTDTSTTSTSSSTGTTSTSTGTTSTGTTSTSAGPTSTSTTGPIPLDGPPVLIDVEFVGTAQLNLFFSEPLSASSDVEPSQFRLSAAFVRRGYGYGSDYTRYNDFGSFDRQCMEYCFCEYYSYGETGAYCVEEYCFEYCPYYGGERLTFVDVRFQAGAPDQLRLVLDRPVTATMCDRLRERDSELFLHYSNGGGGQVFDTEGEILRDIAEHWVINNSNYGYQQGRFPFLDPRIPIPCPL